MKTKIAGIVVVFLLLVPAVVSFAGDDVLPLVDQGRKAVSNGEYQEALDLFQQVVQKLQAMMSESIEKFFPAALGGWEAGEIRNQSWAGATTEGTQSMTNVERRYTRTSDDARCTITITNWPQMVQGLRQSLQMYKQMEHLMNADPTKKISLEDKDGWTLMKIVDTDRKSVEINAVHENMIVNIKLNKDETAPVDQYIGAIDLAGLVNAGTK